MGGGDSGGGHSAAQRHPHRWASQCPAGTKGLVACLDRRAADSLQNPKDGSDEVTRLTLGQATDVLGRGAGEALPTSACEQLAAKPSCQAVPLLQEVWVSILRMADSRWELRQVGGLGGKPRKEQQVAPGTLATLAIQERRCHSRWRSTDRAAHAPGPGGDAPTRQGGATHSGAHAGREHWPVPDP